MKATPIQSSIFRESMKEILDDVSLEFKPYDITTHGKISATVVPKSDANLLYALEFKEIEDFSRKLDVYIRRKKENTTEADLLKEKQCLHNIIHCLDEITNYPKGQVYVVTIPEQNSFEEWASTKKDENTSHSLE